MPKKILFIIVLGFLLFSSAVLIQILERRSDYNLVIISITSLSQNHMSVYGYERNTTPNIDKFAEGELVFENFFTTTSRTVPAGLSLFTSQYPYTHTVWDWYKKSPLDPKTKTFTQLLKERGYKTTAFTGGGQYNRLYGFDRGFDKYVDDEGEYVGFAENMNDALNWLEENKNNKFFLFLQSFDAHCPYFPPSPYDTMFDPDYENKNNIDYSVCYWSYEGTKPVEKEGEKKFPLQTVITWGGTTIGNPEEEWQEVLFDERDIEHLIALYDGSIAYADYQVGKILNKLSGLGLNDNTIVVLLSEHGDVFRKNEGQFMRGGLLLGTFYDDVLKVPLIIKLPKMQQGKRTSGLAQIIDVAPTILELLGIEKDEGMEGKSLFPLMYEDKEVNEYVYAGAENYRPKTMRHPFRGITQVDVIRNKEWKLIKETMIDYDQGTTIVEYELYQIKEDPKEQNNLFGERPSIASDLKIKLQDWILKTKKSTASEVIETEKIEEELIEEGRKRGYW